jgi:hypothetical protein
VNISSFLSGNFLSNLDLPAPSQVWTINKAEQKLVGSDTKVCVTFSEFPSKPMVFNKTNLVRTAELYGLEASAWPGKQLQVYRSTTSYSGKVVQCMRVCGPGQATPEPVCDAQGNLIPPVTPAPAVPMAVQQQPVATPQQQPAAKPWETDLAALQQNSPPSA